MKKYKDLSATEKEQKKSDIKFCGFLLLCVSITIILFKTVLFTGYVPSESMVPTLNVGDVIFGERISPHMKNGIKDGDIVIFKMEDRYLIKRVFASGGEHVDVIGNGKVAKDKDGKKVPKNHYYMLGDNSKNSYDSRYWENPYVDKKDIVAKYHVKIPIGNLRKN